MIRQAFRIDPYALSDEDFAERLNEAVWLKQFDKRIMESALETVLAKAFGEKD